MSEVIRYLASYFPYEGLDLNGQCARHDGEEFVHASDFDRVTAERDAALAAEQIAIGAVAHNQLVIKELQQSLTAADERADVLATALNRIQFRCQSFIEGDRAMAVESVEAVLGIAEAALKPAEPETYQGIPGTSFQRLNALANQGE